MPVDDRDWDQHHRAIRHRLGWAPLAANGVLVASLVAGAAKADDPQLVLQMFTIPLAFFGLGAAAGLVGEEIALGGDEDWKRGTAWWEDEDGPVKVVARIHAGFAEIMARPPRTEQQTAEIDALARKGKELAEKAQAVAPRYIEWVRSSQRLRLIASVLRGASMFFCAAGFGILLAVAQSKI